MENQLNKVKFVQLRSEGSTYNEISSLLGVSKTTLIKWSKEYECEIHNEIELRKESLRKEHNLTQDRLISFKSKLAQKIEDQLLESNFSDIPKDKLIQIFYKIFDGVEATSIFKEIGMTSPFDLTNKWSG